VNDDLTLLTAEELAAILRVSVQSIYTMSYRNEGPRATKIGSRLRFARSDVALWLKAQKATT